MQCGIEELLLQNCAQRLPRGAGSACGCPRGEGRSQIVAGSALTAPRWCWNENKEQAAAFLEAWTHSTWQENLVFFSPKSLAHGTIMFALDSAAAGILLIWQSLSFLIQAIDVSYLDLLPIQFGLSG